MYNLLGKDGKKHGEISTYFCLNIVVERSQPLSRTVYPNRNHATTHPDIWLAGNVFNLFRSVFHSFVCNKFESTAFSAALSSYLYLNFEYLFYQSSEIILLKTGILKIQI